MNSLKKTIFHPFFLLLLASFLIYLPSLIYPYMNIDEVLWGEFTNTVLNGCPPYVCAIGEKPPLLYLFYTSIFYLFGKNNYFWIHLIHIFWVYLTACLICRIASPKKTFLPGLFYLLIIGILGFDLLGALGESLMNLFLVVSWIVFLNFLAKPTKKQIFLSGFCIGLASLFRQQAGIQILAFSSFLVFDFFRKRSFSLRQVFQSIILLGLAFCLPWALALFTLKEIGSYEAFRYWGFTHNQIYIEAWKYAPGLIKNGIQNLILILGKSFFFWATALVGIYQYKNQRIQTKVETAFFSLIFSLIAISAGFRFYTHYFIQCFPFLAYLSFIGWEKALSSTLLWRRLAQIGFALSLLAVLLQNIFVGFLREHYSSQDYSEVIQKIGSYIRDHSNAEDKIMVWGWGQGVYTYSNRNMGTRFIIPDFLTGRVPGSEAKAYTKETAKLFVNPHAWEWFFEDMQKNKPLYFVDTAAAGIHYYRPFSSDHYPALVTYLDQNYFLEKEIEGTKIYRLKSNNQN